MLPIKSKVMKLGLVAVTLAVFFQQEFASASSLVPETMTAAELWNPTAWFYPYAIAISEGYRDYYAKAQKATNDLYKQVYATNAFPWITGNWGGNRPQQTTASSQSTTQAPSSSTTEATSSTTSSTTTESSA